MLEIGKPRPEALIEVATALDAIRWTRRHAASVLRERRAGPGLQRLLLMGTALVRTEEGWCLPPSPAYAPSEPTIVPPGTWQSTPD